MRKLWLILIMIISTAVLAADKLSLQECIDLAMEKNPDLSIALKNVNASKLNTLGSYGPTDYSNGILPRLYLGSSSTSRTYAPTTTNDEYGRLVNIGSQTSNIHGAGISLNQNIFDGGRWWNAIKIAKIQLNGQMLSYDHTKQLVKTNVTESFYNVLKSQELLKVYKKSLENSREQLNKTTEMHKIGQVAKKDLFKAQVNEGNDRLAVIQQKSVLKSAIAQLNVAIGQSPNSTITIFESEYKTPEKIDTDYAISTALKSNKEYNALLLEEKSANIGYQMTKSSWYPTLSSSFGYDRGGAEFGDIYSNFNKSWQTTLNFSLNFTIFNGFSRKTSIQRQYLTYKKYEDEIEKKRIDIENQIQGLILELDTYREMITINELNIESAQEDLRLAQEMYRLASATLLEVLDAQVTLTTAQQQLINTMYDAKIAEIKLAVAMGTL